MKDLFSKKFLELKKDDYLILADMHMSEEKIENEEYLIEQLKKNPGKILILLGDTFQGNPEKAIDAHARLYAELTKHHFILVKGNNDIGCGFEGLKCGKKILIHGHQLSIPFMLFPKASTFVAKIISYFKPKRYKGINHNDIPQRIKNMLAFGNFIIGHYHQDRQIGNSHILAPRRLYLFSNFENIFELQ